MDKSRLSIIRKQKEKARLFGEILLKSQEKCVVFLLFVRSAFAAAEGITRCAAHQGGDQPAKTESGKRQGICRLEM